MARSSLSDRFASEMLRVGVVEEHPSQFNATPALWVEGSEFANFHPRGRVYLRLTRKVIAGERARLRGEANVELRSGDWIMIALRRQSDLPRALELGALAVAANRTRPGTRRKSVPDDRALARRRRQHGSSAHDLDAE